MMQQGHLSFSLAIHFSVSSYRSTFCVLTKSPARRAPVRIFCNVSRLLRAVIWSHLLQSDIFLFEAQAFISQFGLPSPFKHPRHKGIACIDVSPLLNSLKSKSLGAHSSRPYLSMISPYPFVSSLKTPLPTTQLPHQIPQNPIWFLTFSKGPAFTQLAPCSYNES